VDDAMVAIERDNPRLKGVLRSSRIVRSHRQKCFVPTPKITAAFDKFVEPLPGQIRASRMPSRTLATLHDTLLAEGAERGVKRGDGELQIGSELAVRCKRA